MSLTKEQQELRRSGVGASEVAGLIGLSKWARPIDVFASKTLPTEEVDPLADLVQVELGNMLEEPVARIYAKRTGRHLRTVYSLRHPTFPIAMATPDRAAFLTAEDAAAACPSLTTGELLELRGTGCERLVQVKTTGESRAREWGPPGSDQVPDEVVIQTNWEMGVTGIPLCDVPVLFRGDFGVRVEIYTVAFNEALFENLRELVERFWVEHVVPGIAPPVDASDRYADFLRRAYPASSEPAIIATEAVNERLLRFAKLREASHRLDKAVKLERAHLTTLIGNASGITSVEYGSLTFKRTKDSTTVDWRKAANEALLLAGLMVKRLPEDQRPGIEKRIASILPEAVKLKKGHRVLRAKWTGEAALELARLNLTLDALTEAEERNEEKELEDHE